jgi:phage protein D
MTFEARTLRITLPVDDEEAIVESVTAEPAEGDGLIVTSAVALGWHGSGLVRCADFWTKAVLVTWFPSIEKDTERLATLRQQLETRLAEVDRAQRATGDGKAPE